MKSLLCFWGEVKGKFASFVMEKELIKYLRTQTRTQTEKKKEGYIYTTTGGTFSS